MQKGNTSAKKHGLADRPSTKLGKYQRDKTQSHKLPRKSINAAHRAR